MPNFPSAFDCAGLFVARIYSANKMALQRITINRDISFISFITGFYFHQGGVRSSALPPHLEGRGDFQTLWETIEWKRYNRKKKREKGRWGGETDKWEQRFLELFSTWAWEHYTPLGRLQTFGSGSIFWKLPLEIPSLFNFVKKNCNLHYLRFF